MYAKIIYEASKITIKLDKKWNINLNISIRRN